jgi:phage terminase large subunit GpA-like protein
MFLPYGALPWVALMRQYESAKAKLEQGSEEAMIAFYNTRLAQCWARTKESTSHEELQERAGGYRVGEVPAGAVVLTASIDTQGHRLELLIVGWGEGLECWVVDYQVVHGSPAESETWERADALLRDRYRHASGNMLPISAAFVDSGGSNTQDVYTYTAALKRRKVFPVKGHSRPNKPIISGKPTQAIIDSKGKSVRKAASLWMIGTDTAKDYLHARWKRKTGAGAIHFPEGLPESFYKGLTAEYRASGYKRGRKVSWWEQKVGEANEPLDLMVYNLAAAHYLQLHKHSEQRWNALRARLATVDGEPALAVIARRPDAEVERPRDPAVAALPQADEPPPPAPAAPTRVMSGGRISLAAFRRRFA